MSGARNLFLSGSAACAACLLASCASDVPVPEDTRAQEWSPAIKSSYSSWQPPKEMPKGNPEYEKAIAKAHEARNAPVAPPAPAAKKSAPAPATASAAKPAPAPAPAAAAKPAPAPAPAVAAAKPAPAPAPAAAAKPAPAPAPAAAAKPAPAPAPAAAAAKPAPAAPAPAPAAKKNAAPAPAPARKQYVVDRTAKPSEYVVVKGDSLSLISKNHYKDGNLWYIVYQENKDLLKNNANKLRPGMKLKLPAVKQKDGAQ